MSDRMTDEELAEFVTLVDTARRDGEPSESGSALDEFLDSHVKQIADELRTLRQQALTEEEREALEWVRHQCKRAEHGHPTYKTKTALSVLDRLLSKEGKRVASLDAYYQRCACGFLRGRKGFV